VRLRLVREKTKRGSEVKFGCRVCPIVQARSLCLSWVANEEGREPPTCRRYHIYNAMASMDRKPSSLERETALRLYLYFMDPCKWSRAKLSFQIVGTWAPCCDVLAKLLCRSKRILRSKLSLRKELVAIGLYCLLLVVWDPFRAVIPCEAGPSNL
jgi:hypothetical protein